LYSSNYPTLVLGFHACRRSVGESLIANTSDFKPSRNRFDWLGHGMYFWENSHDRAKRFAADRGIEDACVVGATLHLGHCLDLTDSQSLSYLKQAYNALVGTLEASGIPLPTNKPGSGSDCDDLLLRDLDCAVINFLHVQRKEGDEKAYDSVRGVFWEGNELYPGAGFREKNHIQLCIRNQNCIKGLFWPRETDSEFDLI